jgi:Ca2+/Na+ antiporter
MKYGYLFFEVLFYKFNKIKLIGQDESYSRFFASLLFVLALFVNLISIFVFLLIDTSVLFKGSLKISAIMFVLYTILYLLFIRNKKYEVIEQKYDRYSATKHKKINIIFWLYILLTIVLFVIAILIRVYVKKNIN